MTQASPHSFVMRRVFPASAAEVYAAWITPAIMREWLAPGPNVVISIDADVREGGAFEIRSRAPDEAIHTIRGRYRTLEAGRRIVMTWTYTGPVGLIAGQETLIEIDLDDEDGGSRTAMTFRQSRFTSKEAADAFEGDWPSCFAKLDEALDGDRSP